MGEIMGRFEFILQMKLKAYLANHCNIYIWYSKHKITFNYNVYVVMHKYTWFSDRICVKTYLVHSADSSPERIMILIFSLSMLHKFNVQYNQSWINNQRSQSPIWSHTTYKPKAITSMDNCNNICIVNNLAIMKCDLFGKHTSLVGCENNN